MADPINNPDAVAANDEQRTKRAFIGILANYWGLDQTAAGYDSAPVNSPYQYQTIGPGGAVGVEGAPRSNLQGAAAAAGVSGVPLLLLGAVAAVLAIRLLR